MRKFTLTLLLALFATITYAQKLDNAMSARPVLPKALQEQVSTRAIEALPMRASARPAAAPRKAMEIITETPAGELKTYKRTGNTYYSSSGNVATATQEEDESLIDIVFDADGKTVYLQNPVCYYTTDAWVKGTISNGVITVPTLQSVAYNENYKANLLVTFINYVDGKAEEDVSTTEIVYTIDDKGTISLQNSSATHPLAVIWEDDRTWTRYGDWNSVYTETEAMPETTPPANAEVKTYTLQGTFYASQQDNSIDRTANIAIVDDNNVYIQGLNPYNTNAWVKGYKQGDDIVLPTGQYFGKVSGSYTYMLGYNGSITDVTLTWNAEDMQYTANELMFVNGKPDEIYYYGYWKSLNLISPDAVEEPLVELPAGVETVEWYMTAHNVTDISSEGSISTSDVDFTLTVGFDGNDVYMKGFCEEKPESWIKGTRNGNDLVFPTLQYLGRANGSKLWWYGCLNDEELTQSDVTFKAQSDGTYEAEEIIVINSKKDQVHYSSIYWPNTVISTIPEAAVELPEGAEPKPYTLLATIKTKESEEAEEVEEEYKSIANVAVVGDQVYIQGLCEEMPEAWVVGTNAEGTVTIPSGQYLGKLQTESGSEIKTYLIGINSDLTSTEDIVFDYDADTDTYMSFQVIALSLDKTGDNGIYDVLYPSPMIQLVGVQDVPATPSAPYDLTYNKWNNTQGYSSIRFKLDATDDEGNAILPNKLYYAFYSDINGTVNPITFTSEYYQTLAANEIEELPVIPYTFDDNYDFDYRPDNGYRFVFFNDPAAKNYNKVGIRAIYAGGTEEDTPQASEIVWIETGEETGIELNVADKKIANVTFTDLSGRRVANPRAGVFVKTITFTDGTTRTVKAVVK